jgi:hypothetical protein
MGIIHKLFVVSILQINWRLGTQPVLCVARGVNVVLSLLIEKATAIQNIVPTIKVDYDSQRNP